MGKNIRKIQDMLSGDYKSNIQVGYGDQEAKQMRQEGDVWEDSDGVQWVQKNGFISKVSSLPAVGIFDKQCKDCDKNCSMTNGDIRHYDTWKRMGRCFHCQLNYELDLKNMKIGENGNKWDFWVKLQMLQRWDSIDKEIEQLVIENSEVKVNDKALMNALANENERQAREQVKKSSQ
tara:strand:- start:46 stop:576 length:531 start_codon:yes stop_codon:yes gene_type:complete